MPDIKDIEQDLARDRDALRAQVHALSGGLRPGRLIDGVIEQVQKGASDAVGPVLKSRTAPLALTGVGISWLAVNFLTRGSDKPALAYDTRSKPIASGMRSRTPEGPEMAEFDARLRAADANDRKGRFGTETYEQETTMSTLQQDQPTIRDRAYASATSLREKLEDGIDSLPDAAKTRVRAAREAAIEAQGQFEHHTRRTAAAARQTAHENPLLIGALAFAAGAAIAAALPRTSTENRAIGARRDQLFDEADRVFREEVEKAKGIAHEMVAKGQGQIKDKIETAADGVSQAAEKMKSDKAKSRSNGAAHN